VIADLHFAPTDFARANLLMRGFPMGDPGYRNTVIDALNHIIDTPMPAQVSNGCSYGELKRITAVWCW
jgi:UDP-N-acetylglucosamine 2-epimerase